jgi:hypothetical protein
MLDDLEFSGPHHSCRHWRCEGLVPKGPIGPTPLGSLATAKEPF